MRINRFLHPIQWFMSRLSYDANEIILHRKRIYIVPAKHAYWLGLILIAMLFASLNYDSSLGFILTFLLCSIILTVMLHSFRNLLNLSIRLDEVSNVFSPHHPILSLKLQSRSVNEYFALAIECEQVKSQTVNLLPLSEQSLTLGLPIKKRGKHLLPRIKLYSTFPMGLFYVWTVIIPKQIFWIYPQPSGRHIALPIQTHQSDDEYNELQSPNIGHDEFYGVRDYQAGDALKNISWKSLAKGQSLQTKEFISNHSQRVLLDEKLLKTLPVEKRISQLTQWVIDAHKSGVEYSLKIKNMQIKTSKGELHKTNCLKMLAEYSDEHH